MKQLKRIFSALLALALILSCAPQLPLRAEAATVASGTCGDNVTWTLDDAGTLTISGTGAMKEYTSSSNEPWYSVRIDVKKVVIKNGVTTIDSYAFYNCYSLTSVEIPNSVTTIGNYAFCNCVSLTSVEIPDSVTTIGEYAFPSCNSLTSVEIPASVTTIGDYAFYGCDSLTEIRVDPNNPNYSSEDGVLFNKAKTTLIQFPGGKGGAYTVPSSVTTIGEWAFKYCTSLTSVEMGDSVTTIGEDAFYGCYSLTSVEIPDSVTTIGEWTFRDCDSLTSVEIPDSVTEIGDYAFYFCDSLTSVEIPSSVTTIGQYAFAGCKKLTGIFFEGSAPKIGSSAFQYVTATAYYYPDETWTSTKMGNYGGTITWVARECSHSYSSVVTQPTCAAEGYTTHTCLRCGKTYMDSYVDETGHSYEAVVTAPVLGAQGYTTHTCTKCGDSYVDDYNDIIASGNCGTNGDNVKWKLDITGTLTIYGTGAMEDYNILSTKAPWYDYGTGGLVKKVVIENGVTTIGEGAFYSCASLANVEIPASVSAIGAAFSPCTSLTEIQVDSNNESYCDVDGVLFSKDKQTIVCYPGGKTGNYVIPDTVTTIGAGAFNCCANLASVEIPDSVTTIGADAFDYCTSLGSVEIPASVTTIGNAFIGCEELKEIYFEGSAPKIDTFALWDVTATAYYYPDETWTSTKMGNYGGTITWVAMKKVIASGDFGAEGDNLHWELYDDGQLTISGSGDMGEFIAVALVPWYKYMEQIKKVVIEEGVTTIATRSFYGATALTELQVPKSVTTIASNSLDRCTALTGVDIDPDNASYVCVDGVIFNKDKTQLFRCLVSKTGAYTIPNTVTSIANRAFLECSGLTAVTIPNSVEFIGGLAFSKCTGLTAIEIPDSVTTMQASVFTDCKELVSVKIGNSVKEILDSTFAGCSKLANVDLGSSVENIAVWAFQFCDSLVEIKLPDSLKTIGMQAFHRCLGLKSITIPASVTSIGLGVFNVCSKLEEIRFEGSAPAMDAKMAQGVTVTAYYYPDATWTEDVRQNYGGSITWVALRCEHDFGDDRVCDKCGWRLGDFDGNDVLDRSDVDYLLWHTIYGNELYPVGEEADLDGDGAVTDKDVNLLLLLILFPGWNLQG